MLNNKYLLDTARNFPTIIIFSTLLLGVLTRDQIFFVLFLLSNISYGTNYILKYITERIMGKNKYPIIGIGERPSKKLKSYGMPSGHSQLAASTATFLVLLNNDNIFTNEKLKMMINFLLLSLTLYVMYSRVYEKYHTVQQTIIGSFIGILIGYQIYLIYVNYI